MAFLKQASLKIEKPEISFNSWVGRGKIKKASDKLVDFKKIIADFNPDDYLLTHCTIVASVDVEDAPKSLNFASDKTKEEFSKLADKKDFYITPETSKYINSNGDAWSRSLLTTTYKSFIGAENYLEHVQDPELSKGKILDAILREVDDGKSVFVDILVATNKKHKELVAKIKKGELSTLSMGSVVTFTICSKCGRVASDETETCTDIKYFKGNTFIGEDGKKRVIAELCGHELYPDSNKFIEGSWVENPAFKGAVTRNEIILDPNQKEAFSDKYAPIANLKSMDLRDTAARIMQAFKLVDNIKNSFVEDLGPADKADQPAEDIPADIPEDAPADTPSDEVAPSAPEDTTTPPGELPPVDAPELPSVDAPELPPVEETLPEEPYDKFKKDIKDSIKEQIKKELLEELGIKKENPSYQGLPDLNETLVHSSLSKNLEILKKASNVINSEGFKSLSKYGFSKTDKLKLAMLTKKYSINNDIYKAISVVNEKDFLTFRKYSRKIESLLNRELSVDEKLEIKKLLSIL